MEQKSNVLRVKQVAERTSLSVSTIWNHVKLNIFPQPYKLSARVTVWNSCDIELWLEDKKSISHA